MSIGDINTTDAQNDLALSKDSVREGVNFTLDSVLGSLMRNELTSITVDVCGIH